MHIIIRLLSPVELDGCDCAVISLHKGMLKTAQQRAKMLRSVKLDDSAVYKLEFWGNTMEVYSDKLQDALEAHTPGLLADFHDDDNPVPTIIPEDFKFPKPEDSDPARLELCMTEVIDPGKVQSLDETEFAFSAVVKHTNCELQTHSVTLAQLKEWLKG